MRVQSIWTAVKPRNPTCDRLLSPSTKMAFREMDRIAKADDVSQKIGPMTEALKNPGYILTPRFGPPFVVDLRSRPGRIRIFNQPNLGFVISHRFQLSNAGTFAL